MTFVILRDLFRLLIFVLPLVILVWAVWRWARTSPRIIEPAWRSYVALTAIGLAGASSLLWLVLIVWVRVIGGFPYYDPTLLGFYRWGGLTGMAGVIVSSAGKGKLRWPACGLSLLMVLLWFMAATSE